MLFFVSVLALRDLKDEFGGLRIVRQMRRDIEKCGVKSLGLSFHSVACMDRAIERAQLSVLDAVPPPKATWNPETILRNPFAAFDVNQPRTPVDHDFTEQSDRDSTRLIEHPKRERRVRALGAAKDERGLPAEHGGRQKHAENVTRGRHELDLRAARTPCQTAITLTRCPLVTP